MSSITLKGIGGLIQIYESTKSLIFRSRRVEDNQPVIVKLLKKEYPKPVELTRCRREYEILRALAEVPGVINAYTLEQYRNSLFLVLEDFGSISLRALLKSMKLSPVRVLEIAIQLTGTLGEIHKRNIIHKDINPNNILFDPDNNQLKIIDFGSSTILSRENPVIKNPDALEGTLGYISPEQTGRMNRSLDYRTDFYSLGITLYELLTHRPPFTSSDPMELVHCHIARPPVPPVEVNPEIPTTVSDLVLKLLAKTAEDRYQSAWGIQFDLELCLKKLKRGGEFRSFSLGGHDIPDKFHIPQKLYGRDKEIESLMSAFARVSKGEKELMLVTGLAGIGKSVLVQEIYKPITGRRGYYISGKFDQFQRNIPYTGLVDAFKELIRQLLTESEAQLSRWKEKLLNALGANGGIIIEVLPEIELIIGPQPEVLELPAAEARNRFNLVFARFVEVFYQPEHPLVIFLDDLQWVDPATLGLIELLITNEDTRYLFMIGSYRDNEVDEHHPLTATLGKLHKSGAEISRINLTPLKREHITQLLTDTLYTTRESVKPLDDLVLRKTGGNPFFVNHFLNTLYQEKLITFKSTLHHVAPADSFGEIPRKVAAVELETEGGETAREESRLLPQHFGWQWDLAQIEQMGITDNVVDLMVRKVNRLPEPTREVLQIAACIGNRFDLSSLVLICEQRDSEIFQSLLPSVHEGLVLAVSELSVEGDAGSPAPNASTFLVHDYKFQHDRVQQALYTMLDDKSKQDIHFRLGRLLLANTSEEEQSDKLFDLADHMNLGRNLVVGKREKIQLARLNLKACQKAKYATAYEAALKYIEAAMTDKDDFFYSHHELVMEMYGARAEVEYLNGNYDRGKEYIYKGLATAMTPIEKTEIYSLLILEHTMLGEHEEAIQAADLALELLEIDFPGDDFQAAVHRELAEAKLNLGDRKIASLIDEPEMSVPEKKAAMKVLTSLTPAAYFFKPALYSWLLAKMANISLVYGHVAESGKGYASYGNVLVSELEEYQNGYEFGMLGLRCSQKINHLPLECRCCFVITAFLVHWVRPIKQGEPLALQGYQAGLDSGELLYPGYILAFYHTINEFFHGKNLEQFHKEKIKFSRFLHKTNNRLAIGIADAFELITLNLQGKTESDFSFKSKELENDWHPGLDTGEQSPTVLCLWHILLAFLYYLYDKPVEARRYVLEAQKELSFLNGTFAVAVYTFYSSLILTALYPEASGKEREEYEKELKANRRQLEKWSDNCPENFQHMHLLVAAEWARVKKKFERGMTLYDQAVTSASENGFIQHEALANELAAKFWLERDKEDFAAVYLRKAVSSYHFWGAVRKEEQLAARYALLLVETPEHSKKAYHSPIGSTTTKTAELFDLATIFKVSRTISEEIVLGNLIEKLLDSVMENAGAEKGFLILKREDQLMVVAQAPAGGDTEENFKPYPVDECRTLSPAIVHYVSRTRKNVVLTDAVKENVFPNDPYISNNNPKSIICIPIIRRKELTGILYLENNQVTGAFTEERVTVLRLLASQASISLENAEFYTRLEQSEKKFRSIFENATSGIFQITPKGRIMIVNPAVVRTLGYDSAEELKKEIYDDCRLLFANPADQEEFRELMARNGFLKDFQTGFRCKEGKVIHVSINAIAVQDEEQNLLYYEGNFEDITQKKLAAEMKIAKDAAEAANRSKSQFLANMSHDIRTPLNAILGFADILHKQVENKRQREYLKSIRASGKSLLSLINDILDISKVEAGKLEILYAPMDFKVIISDIQRIFSTKLDEKGLELRVDAQAFPDAVMMDEARVRQVLFNLVSNAIKFTDSGHINVYAVTRGVEEIENKTFVDVEFGVEDTGIGIPDDQIDIIMEPFVQKKGQMHVEYGGTGLGLAISKRLVELMNGKLLVISQENVGSTFKVYLKGVEKVSHDALVSQNQADGDLDTDAVVFKAARILIVDDVKNNRDLLKVYLDYPELELLEAQNGEEAIKMVNEYRPDLVLMDLVMPVMDGHEATRIIKSRETTKDLPVIAATASVIKITAELKDLFDGLLRKPFSHAALVLELTRFLDYSIGSDDLPLSREKENTGTAGPGTIDPGVSARVLSILKEQWLPQWEKLCGTLIVSDVQQFGNEMKELGNSNGLQPLIHWGEKLEEEAAVFDMDAFPGTLEQFPAVLKQLEDAGK